MLESASANDNKLLNELFAAATPAIEDLVSTELQKGKPLSDVAIFVERAFDGRIQTTCGPRRAVVARFGSDARLSSEVRRTIVETVIGAGPHEVPAVLFVQTEGYVAAGVKKLAGELVASS